MRPRTSYGLRRFSKVEATCRSDARKSRWPAGWPTESKSRTRGAWQFGSAPVASREQRSDGRCLTLLCYPDRPVRAFRRPETRSWRRLWPDSEPAVALNSLNQTMYFLRRVFEPSYREDTSPGYVRHESDVIWLDRQLVSSRSQICADFMTVACRRTHRLRRSSSLFRCIRDQFALGLRIRGVGCRASRHAALVVSCMWWRDAVARDMATGHWDRGIVTARRALAIDPAGRANRSLAWCGCCASAARTRPRPSSTRTTQPCSGRGLGIEPPPLDAL